MEITPTEFFSAIIAPMPKKGGKSKIKKKNGGRSSNNPKGAQKPDITLLLKAVMAKKSVSMIYDLEAENQAPSTASTSTRITPTIVEAHSPSSSEYTSTQQELVTEIATGRQDTEGSTLRHFHNSYLEMKSSRT